MRVMPKHFIGKPSCDIETREDIVVAELKMCDLCYDTTGISITGIAEKSRPGYCVFIKHVSPIIVTVMSLTDFRFWDVGVKWVNLEFVLVARA